MKAAMKHLNLTYVSLKAQGEIEEEFQSRVRQAFADNAGRARRLQGGKTGGPLVEIQIKFCTLSGGLSKTSGV